MSFGNSSGTSYGGGLGGLLSSLSGADNVAQEHAGSSGDKDLFSNVLSMVNGKHDQLQNEDVDEDDMVKTHDSYYGSGAGTGGSASSGGIGKAAAMQAMKMFNSGGASGGSGGDSKGKLIGLAMGQAAKLFGEWCPLFCGGRQRSVSGSEPLHVLTYVLQTSSPPPETSPRAIRSRMRSSRLGRPR